MGAPPDLQRLRLGGPHDDLGQRHLRVFVDGNVGALHQRDERLEIAECGELHLAVGCLGLVIQELEDFY